MLVKTVLQVAMTRHCHAEVSPYERGPPRTFGQVIAEIGPTHISKYADIGRNTKKDMRRVMIWQPPRCRILAKVTREGH